MQKDTTTMEAIGIGTAAAVMCVLFSALAAAFWFMFDDSLAEALNYPPIGSLDFLTVWPITLFVRWTLGSRTNESKGSK